MVSAPVQSSKPAPVTVVQGNAAPVLRRIRESCQESPTDGGRELRFMALGTTCRWVTVGSSEAIRRFDGEALGWLAAFEAKYSRFLPDSWISVLNASAGGAAVASDSEIDRILALCHEMHFLTRGVFDPTALPLIRLWDWHRAQIPTDPQIEAARQCVGWRKVERKPGSVRLSEPGMCLDLGGMGKEYAVDQVALLARQCGLTGALVDFGADIRVTGLPADGRPGWHLGLEDPNQPGRAWCGLAVREAAVATSGDYHRGFTAAGKRWGHILDPRTGRPVQNGCRAVHVLAPSCTLAGMLSTAALVLGTDEGLRLIESQPGAEGLLHGPQSKLSSRRFYEHVAS